MIYVGITAEKSEGRGRVTSNSWHDCEGMLEAVGAEFHRFFRMWDDLGHGAAVTYTITVAPEASPKRTTRQGWPLPVGTGVKA